MTLIRFAGVLATTILLLGLAWGCTLDKDPQSANITPDPPQEGSLDDDEYQTTSQAMSMSQGYTNEMLLELFSGIGRIDSISGSPALTPGPGSVFASSEADSVDITYDASTGYWHINVQIADAEQGVSFTFVDTLQFRAGSSVIQWPDQSVTELRAGLRLDATVIDGSPNAPTQMAMTYSEELIVTGEIMSEGVVTANGTGSFYADVVASDSGTTCDFNFEMDAELWDLQFDLSVIDPKACPIGGTLSSSGTLDWLCSGGGFSLDVSGAWEAMATYTGDGVVVVIESEGTRWTYSGPCRDL